MSDKAPPPTPLISDEPPTRPPGSETIDRSGDMPWGHEHLARDLAGLWLYRQEYPDEAAISAFDALAQVLAAEVLKAPDAMSEEDPGPTHRVEVPLWAVQILAYGWTQYRAECAQPRGRTLGEVMEVEGRGQGRRRLVSREQYRMRDWGLALEVAELCVHGAGVDDAIAQIATKHSLSEDRLRTIWKARPTAVNRYLEERGVTSGSGDPDI